MMALLAEYLRLKRGKNNENCFEQWFGNCIEKASWKLASVAAEAAPPSQEYCSYSFYSLLALSDWNRGIPPACGFQGKPSHCVSSCATFAATSRLRRYAWSFNKQKVIWTRWAWATAYVRSRQGSLHIGRMHVNEWSSQRMEHKEWLQHLWELNLALQRVKGSWLRQRIWNWAPSLLRTLRFSMPSLWGLRSGPRLDLVALTGHKRSGSGRIRTSCNGWRAGVTWLMVINMVPLEENVNR